MKREPISYYLRNPTKLIEVSLSQIEKWLQESPYSQPLRTLLAKKLHYNQEVVMDSTITNAATSSSNRTWLYRELYGKTQYVVNSTSGAVEKEQDNLAELDTSISKEIATTEAVVEPISEIEVNNISKDIKEASEDNVLDNLLVDYEEVTTINTLDEGAQIIEIENITTKEKSSTGESAVAEDLEIHEESIIEPVEELESITNTEVVVEPIPTIEIEEPKPIVATLDLINNNKPKLIDLNQSKSLKNIKNDADIKVVRVETDEEFIAGRDEDNEKKKSKSKKIKKNKEEKDKKKKSKKSNKTDKKKGKDKKKGNDKKKKSTKQKDSKKKEKSKAKGKKSKSLKTLVDFWDENEEVSPTKVKKENKTKRKSKQKKKKSKVELLKYDIAVSPIKEEANQFRPDLSEMSSYAQWLLQFTEGTPDDSLKHMSIATKNSNAGIEDISFSSSEVNKQKKKGKKNKRKKKGSVKAKSKSKIDNSLDANEEIISELWADLLAKQGHIKKARKMYLKLSLKYPEKSSYFAGKLENL